MSFKSPFFSDNQKVGITFDLPRKESNCQKYCAVSGQCYINDNLQDKVNKAYRKKLKRNFALLNSKNFIPKISRHLRSQNILRVRFLSNGDIIYSDDFSKSDFQLENIFGLCKECKFNRFWLVTRNSNALFHYITKNEKPENLNILLSIDAKTTNQGILDFCKAHKIQVCYITENPKMANCPASVNGKSCQENECFKCSEFDEAPRVWALHGKNNLKKLAKKKLTK